jgi:hypothetical protein
MFVLLLSLHPWFTAFAPAVGQSYGIVLSISYAKENDHGDYHLAFDCPIRIVH